MGNILSEMTPNDLKRLPSQLTGSATASVFSGDLSKMEGNWLENPMWAGDHVFTNYGSTTNTKTAVEMTPLKRYGLNGWEYASQPVKSWTGYGLKPPASYFGASPDYIPINLFLMPFHEKTARLLTYIEALND